tara:strand:+ start:1335 stop:1436 length:102 start_codon:yes stop_codon:yes gene_type:complete
LRNLSSWGVVPFIKGANREKRRRRREEEEKKIR